MKMRLIAKPLKYLTQDKGRQTRTAAEVMTISTSHESSVKGKTKIIFGIHLVINIHALISVHYVLNFMHAG